MALIIYNKSYTNHIKPLPIATPFFEDESITSWIVRAGLNQGCDYAAILYYHWSDYTLLSLDFDKGFNEVNQSIHEGMAILAKTTREQFDKQTLVAQSSKMGGAYKTNLKLKWIIPIVKYFPKKTTPHPFCHRCMTDDQTAHLKFKWRFSWYVYCDVHKSAMSENCFNCDLPYQPHLIKAPQRYINYCPHCQFKLGDALNDILIFEDAYDFQEMAQTVLQSNHCLIFGESYTASDWFELMLFYINLIRKSLLAPKKDTNRYHDLLTSLIEIDDIPLTQPKSGLAFDSLPRNERIMLMGYAYKLLEISAEHWVTSCLELKFHQSSFKLGKKPIIPVAFMIVLKKLPNKEGRVATFTKKPLQPKSIKAVSASWQRMKIKIEKLETHAKIQNDRKNRKQS